MDVSFELSYKLRSGEIILILPRSVNTLSKTNIFTQKLTSTLLSTTFTLSAYLPGIPLLIGVGADLFSVSRNVRDCGAPPPRPPPGHICFG